MLHVSNTKSSHIVIFYLHYTLVELQKGFIFLIKSKGRVRADEQNRCNERVFSFALGCGHCQNAKPKFLKASEAFAEEPNKAFTAVDCTQDSGKLNKTTQSKTR